MVKHRTLVISHFDWKQLSALLDDIVRDCARGSWEESCAVLQRYSTGSMKTIRRKARLQRPPFRKPNVDRQEIKPGVSLGGIKLGESVDLYLDKLSTHYLVRDDRRRRGRLWATT